MYNTDNLIVGAGLSGAVLAERITNVFKESVLIIDKRSHIGGNVYDYIDKSGICIHKYGPHVFHTTESRVWNYLSNFTEWHYFILKVKAMIDGVNVIIPFNFNSLREIFPKSLASRMENVLLDNFAYGSRISIFELTKCNNPDLSFLANFIYQNVFVGYTEKQWGLLPDQLDPSVASRIPVNVSRDDRYFTDKYQGIPLDGYTSLVSNMLGNPLIEVQLSTDYFEVKNKIKSKRVFFTGMIDEFYGYKHGKLNYRNLDFKIMRHANCEAYQGIPHLNYPNNYDFTRSIEYKYYMPRNFNDTVVVYEFPQQYIEGKNEAYYPIPNDENYALFSKYKQENARGTYIYGRLGDYKYYNMDQAILRALELFGSITK